MSVGRASREEQQPLGAALWLGRAELSWVLTLGNVAPQAQVLAVMGRTKEAEKLTSHILSEDLECLECYRLLSAIYSKEEHYAKVLCSWGTLVPSAQAELCTPSLRRPVAGLSTGDLFVCFTLTLMFV